MLLVLIVVIFIILLVILFIYWINSPNKESLNKLNASTASVALETLGDNDNSHQIYTNIDSTKSSIVNNIKPDDPFWILD